VPGWPHTKHNSSEACRISAMILSISPLRMHDSQGVKGQAKADLIPELILDGCYPCRCFCVSPHKQSQQQSLNDSLPSHLAPHPYGSDGS
jgi:hypothetical protein